MAATPKTSRAKAIKRRASNPSSRQSGRKGRQAATQPKKTGTPKASTARRLEADFEPFAVTATEIAALTEHQFRRFMRDLLFNEVEAYGGSRSDFIDNPGDGSDEGQDGETNRASPSVAPGADAFIPIGRTVWQYKAEAKAPSKNTFKTELQKPAPSQVLKAGGNYRFAAQQPGTNEHKKDQDLKEVAKSLRYQKRQVSFVAQASLAGRARRFPALAFLPFFRRESLKGAHSLTDWRRAHSSLDFDQKSRADVFQSLLTHASTTPRPAHIRVVGPAGVGKSRLVLEVLDAAELGASVIYIERSGAVSLDALLKWIETQSGRCVLVVDECPDAEAATLRQKAVDRSLQILLVTIGKIEEEGLRATGSDLRVDLKPLTEDDVVRVLESSAGLDQARCREIARMTGGFIKLANVVATAVEKNAANLPNPSQLLGVDLIVEAVKSLPGFSDDDDALRFLGILSLCADVLTDDSEVSKIESLLGISRANSRKWLKAAVKAQVLSDRGDRVFVTPVLLAVRLARKVIDELGKDLSPWVGALPPRMQEALTRQMQQLRFTEEGKSLARSLMGSDGPFGDLLTSGQPWASSMFLALGTVAQPEALTQLERALDGGSIDPFVLETDRHLNRTLFRLLWRPAQFEQAFAILLRGLESLDNPEKSALFDILEGALQITLSNSKAPFSERFAAAKAALSGSYSVSTRALVLRALGSRVDASSGDSYSSDDVDDDGRDYWHPRTYGEWWSYNREIVSLLLSALSDPEEELRREAAGLLIDHAAVYIRGRAADLVLSAIDAILKIDPRVGKLRQELDHILAFDRVPPETASAVRNAIATIPQDLASTIRVLVEGWDLVRDRTARGLIDRPNPRDVAVAIASSPDAATYIASLFEPWAKNTGDLFIELARLEVAGDLWPHVLNSARAMRQAWGPALFLVTAHDAGHPTLAGEPVAMLSSPDEFERHVGAEAITRMEASTSEVEALTVAVRAGTVRPAWLQYATFGRWTMRRSPQSVAEMIRAISDQTDGGTLALALAHAAEDALALPDVELVPLLARTIWEVSGHGEWVWQQVAQRVAGRTPSSLGSSIVESIKNRAHEVSYLGRWPDREAGEILQACADRDPSLASSLLSLWDAEPDFVSSIAAASILPNVTTDELLQWATDSSRVAGLARMVPAAPGPLTEALLERFGPTSEFAKALRQRLHPNAWAGSLATLLRGRAEQVATWAGDAKLSSSFRSWAAGASTWLDGLAQREAKRESGRDPG